MSFCFGVGVAFCAATQLTAVFTLLCHFATRITTTYINSNGISPAPLCNFGYPAFRFQAVIYDLYHRHWLSDLSHFAFVIDLVLWMPVIFFEASVVAEMFHWGTWWEDKGPWIAIGITVLAMVLQMLSYSIRNIPSAILIPCKVVYFACFSTMLLLVATPATMLMDRQCGFSSDYSALPIVAAIFKLGLMVGAFFKALTHLTQEPLPPHMFNSRSYSFREISKALNKALKVKTWRTILQLTPGPIIALVSEFQAGYPCRLLPVWLYMMATCIQNQDKQDIMHVAMHYKLRMNVFQLWDACQERFGPAGPGASNNPNSSTNHDTQASLAASKDAKASDADSSTKDAKLMTACHRDAADDDVPKNPAPAAAVDLELGQQVDKNGAIKTKKIGSTSSNNSSDLAGST